jgi:O-antigen/teichoic acid export membrane protein
LVFQGINIFINILYVPLLLNYLNEEKYGIWLTVSSILGWVSLFDIGLSNGLKNKLAESLAKNDFELSKKYISTTYATLIIIFSVFLCGLFVAIAFINWQFVFHSAFLKNEELRILLNYIFTFFSLRFILQTIGIVYTSDQNPAVNILINTISSIISLILILIIKFFDKTGNLLLLTSTLTIIPLVCYFCLTVYGFTTKFKIIRPSFKYIDFSLIKELMSLGIKFFLMQLTSLILFSSSSILISMFFGPSEVVSYNIVFKLFQLPLMFFSIILAPYWTIFTVAFVNNDFDWLRKTVEKLRMLSLLFIGLIILLAIFNQYIFEIWLKSKVKIPSMLVWLLALNSAMSLYLSVYSIFLNGIGKIHLTFSLSFWGILVYIITFFTIMNLFHSNISVVIAIIFSTILGLVIQISQTNRILENRASGIWNK